HSLAQLATQGRIHETRTGRRRIKYFLDETPNGRLVDQAPLDNLWLDIPDMMHLPPAERTGYPTQKPLALLQRLIRVSSNPGDRVQDPFAGAGTTLLAAAQLDRRWTGLEASVAGVAVARARLLTQGATGFTVYEVQDGATTEAHRHRGDEIKGKPEFRVARRDAEVAIALVSAPDPLEYWAVDWQYDGTFRSDWQGWRGYARPPRLLPIEATATLPRSGLPIGIRWETLNGECGFVTLAPPKA
ncbi:MAG: site-specific DNA-methyltransferase, partial [Anaerolineae bacterium]|nr:site-specific DNA-methyltransferase [Anaerolineae bacterium]